MRKSSNPRYGKAKKEALLLKCFDEQLINWKSNLIPTSEICFTALKLAKDNGYVDVFVDCRKRNEVFNYVAVLNKHAGMFRTYLAKELSTYKVPIVRFHADPVVDNVLKINQIFDELKNKDKQNN